MVDLEKLRNTPSFISPDGVHWYMQEEKMKLCVEAADEIEQLRGDLSECRASYARLRMSFQDFRDGIAADLL